MAGRWNGRAVMRWRPIWRAGRRLKSRGIRRLWTCRTPLRCSLVKSVDADDDERSVVAQFAARELRYFLDDCAPQVGSRGSASVLNGGDQPSITILTPATRFGGYDPIGDEKQSIAGAQLKLLGLIEPVGEQAYDSAKAGGKFDLAIGAQQE